MSFVQYLIPNDYLATIQSGQLNDQLLDELNAGNLQRNFAESWAIGQLRSKLKAKYDLDYELTPTLPYNPKKTYLGGDRCVIDFDEYVTGTKYPEFTCVIKDEVGYICKVNESGTSWDWSEWQSLGNQFTIYHIPLPYDRFHIDIQQTQGIYTKGFYKVGNFVWWAEHTYKALRQTIVADHDTRLQYYMFGDIGSPNIFPNDPSMGASWWEDLGEYNIQPYAPVGEEVQGNALALPVSGSDQLSAWKQEDNRDPVIMQVLIDLSLWMLHRRISPMNIPKIREQAKDDAFGWLSSVKAAKDDTELEQLQPEQGTSFRWGSKTKNENSW